jgi:prophage regulatory protein
MQSKAADVQPQPIAFATPWPSAPFTLVRRPRVQEQTGNSRSTLYLRIKQGLFPKPVKLGPRAVAWPAHEVGAVNAARIAGRTEEAIRTLVAQLEADRAAATQERLADEKE